MRQRTLFLALLTLAMVLAGAGVAAAAVPTAPYTTTQQCLQCHGAAASGTYAKAEFTAPVNYGACAKCHWVTLGPSYGFPHEKVIYAPNCSACHTCSDITAYWAGQVSTAYGYFSSAAALSSTPAQIHAIHSAINGPAAGFGSYCVSCHGAVGCATCHDAPASHGSHLSAVTTTTAAFQPVSRLVSLGPAPGVDVSLQMNSAVVTETCSAGACHPVATLTTRPSPTCASCHPSASSATHTVSHVATDGVEGGVACSACHSLDVVAEHAKSTSSSAVAECGACHPQPAQGAKPWTGTCATAGCHTATSSAPMHSNETSSHAVSDSNKMCLGCHSGTELVSIHSAAVSKTTGKSSCLVCHTGVAGQPATSDCTVCHFTFSAHYGTTRHTSSWTLIGCGGTGCHSTRDLMSVHTEKNAAFTCDNCHKNIRVALQIQNHLTGCGDCHSGVTQTDGHRTAHWASPLLSDAAGPHYSYVTGSAGTAPTNDCIGCHASNLIDEHIGLTDSITGALIRLPRRDSSGAALTCDTCHRSTDGSVTATIAAKLTACENCHKVHAPIATVHTSTFVDNPALACADCHKANIVDEHSTVTTTTASGTLLSGCDVCHSNFEGTRGAQVQSAISPAHDTRCSACHASYHAAAVASHEATTSASLACGVCHAAGQTTIDVTAVHSKSALGACKVCHASTRIGAISGHTAECASCHAAEGTDYHRNMTTGHTFTAMGASCQASGCHPANTLPEVHAPFLSRYPQYTSTCALCHQNASSTRINWTTASADCSTCHTISGASHHELHNATAANPTGCAGCHNMYLDDEHASLGYTCDTCHKSTSAVVQGAIAAHDRRCLTCHPGSPHNKQQSWEFNPARASVHRVSADLPGMRSAFTVNGTNYTWTLPATSSFLKAGLTTDSMISCSDCHSYTGATGPHGATMKVNIDPAYPNPFRVTTGSSTFTAQLSKNSPTGMSMTKGGSTAAGIICEKCHDLYNGSSWSTVVHAEHDDRGGEGGYCNYCHIGLPHGWDRPRMIGYSTDATPYATYGGTTRGGGISRISLKSYTPNGWSTADCGAACSSDRHPLTGSSWPLGTGTAPAVTTGTVSGTVKSATGTAISGATVSVGGKTATSGSTGSYSVANVAAGTQTVTVTASGYSSWSGSVSVTAGSSTTQNVTLTAIPVSTNVARTASVSASSYDSDSTRPSYAVDGNTSTYWRSHDGAYQWLRADMGSSKSLDRVVVNWYGSYYARSYRVETSSDGSNWTTRYSTSYGNGGADTVTLTGVTARYVRVYCTYANYYDYRISEFEVWAF